MKKLQLALGMHISSNTSGSQKEKLALIIERLTKCGSHETV
jgi:hypothetical protein